MKKRASDSTGFEARVKGIERFKVKKDWTNPNSFGLREGEVKLFEDHEVGEDEVMEAKELAIEVMTCATVSATFAACLLCSCSRPFNFINYKWCVY